MAISQENDKWTGSTGSGGSSVTEGVRRSATEMIDKAAKSTSEGLLSAAAAVENAGQKSTDAVNQLADSAEEKIAAASQYAEETVATASKYLQRCDPQDMIDTMRDAIRRHPGRAVLMAAAMAGLFGFLAGSRGGERHNY